MLSCRLGSQPMAKGICEGVFVLDVLATRELKQTTC